MLHRLAGIPSAQSLPLIVPGLEDAATRQEAGAAVLLYTSELKEVQLVCDRAIVIFGGRVVEEISGADADEATLLRAAYHLRSDAAMPEAVAAEAVAAEAAALRAPDATPVPAPEAARPEAGQPEPAEQETAS